MIPNLKQFAADEDAVSPVIGVILMVAITVILAAVIGTFVLGLGQQVGQTAPTASVNVQDAGDTFDSADGNNQMIYTLSHNNGDSLEFSDIRVQIRSTDGSTVATFDGSNNWNASNMSVKINGEYVIPSGASEYGIGDSLTINESAGDASTLSSGTDYEVRIIHVPSSSTVVDQTVELN